MPLSTIFLSELVGTSMLLLMGCGVVANNLLPKSKGQNTGYLMVNFGWGLAVFSGVLVSAKSGAHINPAVTIGLLSSGAKEYAPGVAVSWASTFTYFSAQLLGGIIGAVLCYLAYKKQFDQDINPSFKLGVFSTGPESRSYFWNITTEIIATFVLVIVILGAAKYRPDNAISMAWLSALGVSLLVVGIGASLGGPTGYAINPARDLGPRIAHAILPIKGKGSSDWAYSWVPVLGPLIGGCLAGLTAQYLLA